MNISSKVNLQTYFVDDSCLRNSGSQWLLGVAISNRWSSEDRVGMRSPHLPRAKD